MNVDEAMRRFAVRGEFPREALQWALDNWDAASPRLIAKLRAYAGGASQADANLDVLFFVIHLCGEKCDSRAYVPLCDLIASDETIDVWLGETTTGTLAGILINLCDGDVEPLKRAIEAPEADEFARAAAMRGARLPGARQGRPRRRGNAGLPLASGERNAAPRGESASGRPGRSPSLNSATSRCAARSRASSRKDGSTLSRPRSTNSTWIYSWRETTRSAWPRFRRRASSRSDPRSSCWKIGPTGTTTKWEDEDDVDLAEDDLDIDADAPLAEDLPVQDGTPYLNPFRDVGRNDPCPCGSGKKYKKCCLAA